MKIKYLVEKSIKSHTLLTDIFGFTLIKLGFANKYTAGLITMYKVYDRLRKQYFKYIGTIHHDIPVQVNSKTVWICWWQGIENAPEIVKICYNSVCKWMVGWNVNVITLENYKNYVSFPDFIVMKWEKGIISNTLMSDLLRIELLLKYGGLWVDATTLMTGPLPDYIIRNSFFAYRNGWMDKEMINMGSWLLYSSETHNILLKETQNLLYLYWKTHNYTMNYFLFHIFFRMVTDVYSEEWNSVCYINHIDEHLLINECDKVFNENRIKEILNITSIHKLSYKVAGVLELLNKVVDK